MNKEKDQKGKLKLIPNLSHAILHFSSFVLVFRAVQTANLQPILGPFHFANGRK